MQYDRKRLTVEVDELISVVATHDNTVRVQIELREWQAELLLADVARLLGRERTQEVLEANL